MAVFGCSVLCDLLFYGVRQSVPTSALFHFVCFTVPKEALSWQQGPKVRQAEGKKNNTGPNTVPAQDTSGRHNVPGTAKDHAASPRARPKVT